MHRLCELCRAAAALSASVACAPSCVNPAGAPTPATEAGSDLVGLQFATSSQLVDVAVVVRIGTCSRMHADAIRQSIVLRTVMPRRRAPRTSSATRRKSSSVSRAEDVVRSQSLVDVAVVVVGPDPLEHLGEDDVGQDNTLIGLDQSDQFVDVSRLVSVEEVDPDRGVDDDHPWRVCRDCSRSPVHSTRPRSSRICCRDRRLTSSCNA